MKNTDADDMNMGGLADLVDAVLICVGVAVGLLVLAFAISTFVRIRGMRRLKGSRLSELLGESSDKNNS